VYSSSKNRKRISPFYEDLKKLNDKIKMHLVDYLIFGVYMLAVLGIGVYFFKKNKNREDYYVGGRSISALHVGLSIAATDVGGGFSIGLGGLGYMIGLSGSWLLFTGIVGAWLSAVLIIPKIKKIDVKHKLLTFPDFLRLRYDEKVASTAAVISGILLRGQAKFQDSSGFYKKKGNGKGQRFRDFFVY
jgi:Na+/proline symporter